MPEAEDVLTDAARHATEFAQELWRRRRRGRDPASARPALEDVARRLDLLLAAVFQRSFRLRVAQAPVPATWLARWMQRSPLPRQRDALPATDGDSIWLPRHAPAEGGDAEAGAWFRLHALRQAARAVRGAAAHTGAQDPPALRDLHLLLEAQAADHFLLTQLPGLAPQLAALKRAALAARPSAAGLPAALAEVERWARGLLAAETGAAQANGWNALLRLPASAADVRSQAQRLHEALARGPLPPGPLLWRDAWTGELRLPSPVAAGEDAWPQRDPAADASRPARSARLARAPQVRAAPPEEDDERAGAWMVQTSAPHEAAEDPMGLQRPTDRDETTAAQEFADALSELPQARLVRTPERAREVLLSEDAPQARGRPGPARDGGDGERLRYPEWDWRAGSYRTPGATVLLQPPADGPIEWAERTLAERAGMLHEIRRRFELLRARRVRLRRQLDGDGPDLQAWTEARADFRAGLPLAQHLYENERRARRDLAVTLLVDTSGSTDAWVCGNRRIIDVEREALLLVCIALEEMRDPYSVLAFSGEGPQGVVVRPVKAFGEAYGPRVARRIAGLEPEHSTRTGAALRHAAALLIGQATSHRLLVLLSDGKPNDIDEYEGRYGVEDLRQSVLEARMQGVSVFCLTVDRQGASYLPAVFGPHQWALLPRPELLPQVLLEWLRRLVAA